MEKLIIKVTLNSINPLEAGLIKILANVRNRSAHLKMAAFHYWKIFEKLAPKDKES